MGFYRPLAWDLLSKCWAGPRASAYPGASEGKLVPVGSKHLEHCSILKHECRLRDIRAPSCQLPGCLICQALRNTKRSGDRCSVASIWPSGVGHWVGFETSNNPRSSCGCGDLWPWGCGGGVADFISATRAYPRRPPSPVLRKLWLLGLVPSGNLT